MQSGNKLLKVSIISGVIVLALVIVLLVLLFGKEEEVVIERITAPEVAFSYNEAEDYGVAMEYSYNLEEALSDYSVSGYYGVMDRVSAFFKTHYPEHNTLALVKNSFNKAGDEGKEKYSLGLVTDLGTIVWLEVDGNDYSSKESEIRLYNFDKELVYQDNIKWGEMEKMDANNSEEGNV